MSSTSVVHELFSPVQIGPLQLPNRVFMAPLTRNRAEAGNIPSRLNAEYYAQRSSAGLIIAEATQISQQGQGYPSTPGIYTPEQVAGWRLVTEAVHARGGRIFLQLWHVGAISHSSFQPGGGLPVSPSGVRPAGQTLTADWKMVPFETPRALDSAEIPGLLRDYQKAARNAREAGFDGVEVHGANGYLLEQFLMGNSNRRQDRYGGSIENRSRLLFEVLDEVAGVWGGASVGVRLSPWGRGYTGEDDVIPLYRHVFERMAERELAYVHLIEPHRQEGAGPIPEEAQSPLRTFRPFYPGAIVTAGGYKRDSALEAVESGLADAVAFGRLFISNPDLPHRLAQNLPLHPYDRSTFYGGGEHGYTDYTTAENDVSAAPR